MNPARILAIVLATIALSTSASAQEPEAKKRAAERFRAAEQSLARGSFAQAAEDFERADAILPHAATKMNAAEAWERAGEYARAADLAERVQASSDPSEAKPRAAATAMLARLAPKLPAKLAPELQQTKAEPAKPKADPEPERELVKTMSAPALATSEAPAPEAKSGGVTPLAWASFGLAAAGVGVFGVFGAKTLSAQKAYDADPSPSNREAFHDNKMTANIALAAAGVFAATGLVLVITSPREKQRIAILPNGIVGQL